MSKKENPIYFDYDPHEDPYGEAYQKFLFDKFGEPDEIVAEPPEPFPMVTRAEWGAEPPKEPETLKPLVRPIAVALFTHTSTEECHSREECIKFLQERQKLDYEEKDFNDIQYNFYISSDGTIYEGRGWDYEADKEEDDYETVGFSVDIAYIGNYEDKDLPDELVDKGCEIIYWARKQKGMIHDNMNITSFWEDHIHKLREFPKTNYNPLDDPETRDEEYRQQFVEPPDDLE